MGKIKQTIATCLDGTVVAIEHESKLYHLVINGVKQQPPYTDLHEAQLARHKVVTASGGAVQMESSVRLEDTIVKGKKDFGQAFSPDRGYVTDKELFQLAHDQVMELIEHKESVLEGIEKHPNIYRDEQPRLIEWHQGKLAELKAKSVYLKEVLDGLG